MPAEDGSHIAFADNQQSLEKERTHLSGVCCEWLLCSGTKCATQGQESDEAMWQSRTKPSFDDVRRNEMRDVAISAAQVGSRYHWFSSVKDR